MNSNANNTSRASADAALLLYATAPTPEIADQLAEGLVAGRLAACVNCFPGMRSVYRWEGAVERAEETAMIVKTTPAKAAAARAFIVERHPHDTPAVVALRIDAGTSHGPFLDWIAEATADG